MNPPVTPGEIVAYNNIDIHPVNWSMFVVSSNEVTINLESEEK